MPQNNNNSRLFLTTSICAVLGFCIPAFFLFKYSYFSNLWLLYLGNGLFACVMFASVLYYNNQRNENANLGNMISLNLKIMATCIVSICVFLILLHIIFHNETLKRAPVNEVKDSANGLGILLYVDAVIVNFLFGSFAVLMASFTAKRSQKIQQR